MAIVVNSNIISDEVVDKNGNLLAVISYNPEDTKSFTKLSDIISKIYQIQDKIKSNASDIKEIPNRDLTIEELEEYRITFEKTNEILHFQENTIEEIFKDFDYIFGEGTCKNIMGNSQDLTMLMPIIESAKPNFEKSRTKKVNKYVKSNKKNHIDDVME